MPLGSEGQAAIVELSGAAPLVPGDTAFDLTLTWGQLGPRPFCSSGPLDWVYVEGPVTLTRPDPRIPTAPISITTPPVDDHASPVTAPITRSFSAASRA